MFVDPVAEPGETSWLEGSGVCCVGVLSSPASLLAAAAALSAKPCLLRDTEDDRLRESVGVLPSGTCSLRATFCAWTAWPEDMLLTTSGRISAHICRALIEPHSMILLFSQWRDTGFVRKSLHPAASAATRSLCNEDAVRATMMTDDLYGGVDIADDRDSLTEASDGVR